MLSFLSASVDLVELKDGQLIFRSTRRFTENKEAQVRVSLTPGKLTSVRVFVDSARPAERGGFVYVGRILGAAPDQEVTGAVRSESVRGAVRHTLGLRVMSRDLPGYHGLTVDLSRTGVQIEVSGPLEKGKRVHLDLEFDRFDLPRLQIDAEVMWCRSHAIRENNTMGRDNRYRCGMRFHPADANVQHLLDGIANFFEQRSQEDLNGLLDKAKLLREEEPAGFLTKSKVSAAPANGRRTSFVLPVSAQVTGYRWECTGGLLVVLRDASGDDQGLEFPRVQTVRDHSCAVDGDVAALRTSTDTELVRWARDHRGPGAWRHYEFLDAQGGVLLDVVSEPFQEYL